MLLFNKPLEHNIIVRQQIALDLVLGWGGGGGGRRISMAKSSIIAVYRCIKFEIYFLMDRYISTTTAYRSTCIE